MLDEAVVLVGDLMTRDVAAVRPETPLSDAVRTLAQRHISGMPVIDDRGHVVGMFSEADLVRWHEGLGRQYERWLDMLADGHDLAPTFLEAIRTAHHRVAAVMSRGAITVTENTSAREVANLFHVKGIKRVPVLRDGKLVGIIARSDLVRALARQLADAPPSEERLSVNEALRRRREEDLAVAAAGQPPSA